MSLELQRAWSLFQTFGPVGLRVVLIVFGAVLLARAVTRGVSGKLGSKLLPQQIYFVRSFGGTAIYVVAALLLLQELGIDPNVLLGAAGFLTVAIGFASQTSVSNLISGLFLIFERPFGIGDAITIDGLTGEVLSIDLLSIKIRTFDNLYVRVPNEAVLKARVTTLTRYPIRRVDLTMAVAFGSDLARVRTVLLGVAQEEPLVLLEPAPQFVVLAFGATAIELQLSFWVERSQMLEAKNAVYDAIGRAFLSGGIQIAVTAPPLPAAPGLSARIVTP